MTLGAAEMGLLRRAARLSVYAKGGERAPHKPLLLLLAVHRAQHGCSARAPWTWWRDALTFLLHEYAPSGTANPQDPFRRLAGDDLWAIPDLAEFPDDAFVRSARLSAVRDLKKGWLDKHDPQAGLHEADHQLLTEQPLVADRLVRLLLQRHFPPTIWEDVLVDAGAEHDLNAIVAFPADVAAAATPQASRRRTAAFAGQVLEADGRRCLLCGYDGLDTRTDGSRAVGLDAAHVRWWHLDGPDELSNGLTLCATHHRLFDRGMYAFHPTARDLRVSARYATAHPAGDLPNGLHVPLRIETAHLQWQWKNVFRRPEKTAA